MLLISPDYILAKYIRGQGLMSDPVDGDTWPLYVSYMPDSIGIKTDMGAIYNAAGKKDGRLMIGTVIEHYGIRLIIRSNTHNTGWAKMETITNNLDAVHNAELTINGEDYKIENVTRILPTPLGVEEGTKKRRLFVSDFLVSMKRI